MITVMFSTHNRRAALGRMLDALTCVRAPAGGWKLIAVDNGSTDGTGERLREYSGRLPMTVLSEPRRGKNRALNQALDHAEGDLYVFCDDDVICEPDWLEQWRAIADSRPAYELFAGLTLPLWPYDPPAWILRNVTMDLVFSTNAYRQEGECLVVDMHGTNFAIRASALANGVRYGEHIGPDGSPDYAMGSETELNLRLGQRGYKCWFACGPAVKHIIRPEQFDAKWIVTRAYRWGRGMAHLKLNYPLTPTQAARRNWARSRIYPLLMPWFNADVSFRKQWSWMADCGYEDGSREIKGLPPLWRNADGPVVAKCFLAKLRDPAFSGTP